MHWKLKQSRRYCCLSQRHKQRLQGCAQQRCTLRQAGSGLTFLPQPTSAPTFMQLGTLLRTTQQAPRAAARRAASHRQHCKQTASRASATKRKCALRQVARAEVADGQRARSVATWWRPPPLRVVGHHRLHMHYGRKHLLPIDAPITPAVSQTQQCQSRSKSSSDMKASTTQPARASAAIRQLQMTPP